MGTSRLAYHTCMLRPHGGMKLVLPSSTMSSIKSISPQEHQISREEFWEKNKRLARPMSPHLTIYKPQMTSMLSITHRGTGLAQSVILSGFAIFGIASNYSFPWLLSQVSQLGIGGGLIFVGKFAIAWPVMYHLFNGCRHLAWDMGHGFSMPELYKTGYTVLGLSIISAAIVSLL